MANLRSYLHAAVPALLTDDGVAVVDLRSYLAKIDREYATQRYAETDAPLLYIRIQIGKATCSALIDCGASCNFMSQAFMARAGLGPHVRRKTQPMQVSLADDRTQKSIDRCIDGIPVYFAPLACESVSFDILDTKFDMILGMSWLRSADHPVNFHDRTVHVRDRNGVLVPCMVATPHTSIACHVVSVARIRDAIARNDVEEMGLVFLHALPSPDGPAVSPSDPRIIHLLDGYGDVFEAPTGTVPDRPIRHGITLEAGVIPPRGCIYRMSEEELEVLRTQLDDLLDKAKYKANRDKCEFAKQELEYLGHYVMLKGIRPLADKIQAIVDWSEPRCTTDVRSFMGLAGYYHCFVESYSKVAAPLSKLQSPKCEGGVLRKGAERRRRFRPQAVATVRAGCGASIAVDFCTRRLRVAPLCRLRDCKHRKGGAFRRTSSTFVAWGSTTQTTAERRDRFHVASMEGGAEGRRDPLTHRELQAVATAVSTIILRCQQERALGRLKEQLSARRRRKLTQDPCDGADYVATSEAVVQLCYALGCGVIPRATPRWWVKRRTGGTWEDLRQCDDATDDYFRDKLQMSPRVFREIAEACAPHLQRRVTFYRQPLQPDQIVAYALYKWASGETYESSTCNFGIGRASGLIVVRDVTAALLRVFGEKIAWPTGLHELVILRAFVDKGFPNCHGCIYCTHVYVDKPANAPSENYYDRKRRFSIVAQVVVDLDLRVLDVHMGYTGSCHNIRVLQLSSLSLPAKEGSLFHGPPVTLSFGVKTNGYVLANNGYPPSEWMVVPLSGGHKQCAA
ncbi:hypothetical protein CBR_g39079 [Chara braunii]|uniref:DDE Tnp4 domain-containing protein n=1 Tax=Chara braunii TaxID=69332 RepID=A0A388LR55_CHABU|nr:hypothetical protein CBR_g39079 [Chara braunii]|eukprot:GBG84703.1 hypothetical protein CBR_g39079 [Chara braunii]